MSYFLEINIAVAEILHKYVPPEGVHVYSDFNELELHENYLLLWTISGIDTDPLHF